MDPNTVKPESLAAQSLGWVDPVTKAISPAIHASTTFIRDADNQYRNSRSYARADNPAFDQAEQLIAQLEHGAQGALSHRAWPPRPRCSRPWRPVIT